MTEIAVTLGVKKWDVQHMLARPRAETNGVELPARRGRAKSEDVPAEAIELIRQRLTTSEVVARLATAMKISLSSVIRIAKAASHEVD
ncbi:MAG: hypothetical protein ACRCY9_22760 [Phycicoccus sp.]